MSDDPWEWFIGWGLEIVPRVDLNLHEHSYKRQLSAKLADARGAFLRGDAAWAGEAVSALQGNNLLHWLVIGKIKDAAVDRREALRAAVAVLWDSLEPAADDLIEFEKLALVAIPTLSPGNLSALGGLLLMARDAESFPPYRATPVLRWSGLVGLDPPGNSPTDRYGRLLSLCDELLARGGSRLSVATRLEAQGLAWALLKWDANDLGLSPDQVAELRRWRGEKVEKVENGSVDRGCGPAPEMEAAAWRVLGAGLRHETSPITGGGSAWTAAAAADLQTRMADDPGPGVGGFLDKLLLQLRGAPEASKLLAAELVYLQCAPLMNISSKLKIKRVQAVLSTISAETTLPSEVREGLEAPGAFHGGQGFNAQIARHIAWLCQFVHEWTDLEPEQRTDALADPMAFAAMAAEVSQEATISIEHSLNYLAWPGVVSPVVSGAHRRRIRDAFAREIGGATGESRLDVTRDLIAIRHQHEKNLGHFVQWYNSPYREVWDPPGDTGQRAWLVRPNPGHRPLVERWLDTGYVSLKAQHLGRVEPGSDRPLVQIAVDSGYQHLDYAQRNSLATEYHAFLSRMSEEDLVVTLSEGSVYVGTITSSPTYRTDTTGRLQRGVAWNRQPIDLRAVTAPLPALLDQQGTVVDVTSALEQLQEYADDLAEPELPAEPVGPVVSVVPVLPDATEALSQGLSMPREGLQQIVDVLQDRQQLVLYGPPGTGKTYLARALARHIVGDDDASRARLVQFHPSYSYEDFFEGYRPALTEGGQATFRLQPGPLRQLAAEAAQPENLNQPFVLIIDEMNRSNLAKVFGELYFLLEYRDESIRLQYSPDVAFQLPRNVFIIGTMNTADRSIAMMDAAIRRRFAFLEMHPEEEPVKGVLAGYVTGLDDGADRVRLLGALNEAIGAEDRDLQVGPSYLMRPEAATAAGLERIWRFDILPLLEEHHYGRLTRDEVHRRFGLPTLRARLASVTESQEPGVGSSVEEQEPGPESGPLTVDLGGTEDEAPDQA